MPELNKGLLHRKNLIPEILSDCCFHVKTYLKFEYCHCLFGGCLLSLLSQEIENHTISIYSTPHFSDCLCDILSCKVMCWGCFWNCLDRSLKGEVFDWECWQKNIVTQVGEMSLSFPGQRSSKNEKEKTIQIDLLPSSNCLNYKIACSLRKVNWADYPPPQHISATNRLAEKGNLSGIGHSFSTMEQSPNEIINQTKYYVLALIQYSNRYGSHAPFNITPHQNVFVATL